MWLYISESNYNYLSMKIEVFSDKMGLKTFDYEVQKKSSKLYKRKIIVNNSFVFYINITFISNIK